MSSRPRAIPWQLTLPPAIGLSLLRQLYTTTTYHSIAEGQIMETEDGLRRQWIL